MTRTVLLAGCGNMGYAMLKGWLSASGDIDAYVVEPADALRERAAGAGAKAVAAVADLPGDLVPDMIVLAVKPQVMRDVLPDYARWAGGPATFLSVAAGVMTATYEEALPGDTPVIRCMPNTPASIGKGMMVCYLNDHVSQDARAFCEELLSSSGRVGFVDDEGQMDAVTAVSGSGPAYVFHFIECLTRAGVAAGLPEALSAELAMQTVFGAGHLAASGETPPGTLREQVTSPGGTTAAALEVLMGDGRMEALVTEAVAAAARRSRELA